ECVVVTLFYRRDFLFSIYTKYFTLSKLFNIQHNDELSDKEKWRAIDKVKCLPLGTTEKQAEHDQKIRDQARQEFLADLRKGF
ncbi:hypothetical protein P7D41_12845, partial [Enterococcus hirae]|nr:hypothetical protein [Enterococcus hirae]MCV3180600.1 hypothetical protein [Enterococcus faecium]MDT2623771.1 hypothetical protein [Enterococcus hirae]MDV7829371.1 hypothetical protein [Enterococcus faecium]